MIPAPTELIQAVLFLLLFLFLCLCLVVLVVLGHA
jgi:hypothetical protein